MHARDTATEVTLADHRQSVMASLLSPRPWTLERTHGWQWDWQSATLASEYWPQGHGNETLRLPISKFEECNRLEIFLFGFHTIYVMFAWFISRTFSANEQYVSLTINQPIVLSAMTYQLLVLMYSGYN